MGRKIPGKKHRSIIDPEKQRAKRIESLKNKINNPPRNPDDQEVPRSMLKIMELKKQAIFMDKAGKGKKHRKKKKKKELLCVQKFLDKDLIQPGMKRPDKFIPNLIQGPNETPEKFLLRVNSMTRKIIKESQFEDKFNITIEKDPVTGKVLRVGKNQDGKKKSKGLVKKSHKKTLLEKKREKALQKNLQDNGKDFSHLKDIVEFGEVVHRPPEKLKCSKTLQNKAISEKKGKYKDLILGGLINK